MAQLSRPFQIALLAVGLLAAAWFFALRGHPASTSSSSAPAPSSPAPSASSQAQKAAAPSPIYHGAAPGVEGLTRAIARAHAAVATSQQNAKQLEAKAAQASRPTSSGAAAGASTTGSQAASKGASTTHSATSHRGTSTGTNTPARGSAQTASPSMQATVEGELKQGKVVTILFWNSKSSVDTAVRRELQAVVRSSGGKVAVHYARASQVGSFGSFTHAVQVLQTPTILIVNKRGQTTVLMGLTDTFSLKQAIDEARHA